MELELKYIPKILELLKILEKENLKLEGYDFLENK